MKHFKHIFAGFALVRALFVGAGRALPLLLALLSTAAQAQESLGVWQGANRVYGKLLTDIDSVTFTPAAPQQLQVWKNNTAVYTKAVAEIDSMKYYIDPSTYDAGVVINNVKWATRNVDAVGTFADTPESAGKFYQWNRKVAWSATDPMIDSGGGTTWDTSNPAGSAWEPANDPSPAGWRVPTFTELQSLLEDSKVAREWTTQNGVDGYKFTDRANPSNSIFLPAAGYRYYLNGRLSDPGTSGAYFSSTQESGTGAYSLLFFSNSTEWYTLDARRYGFTVRAVAE